MAALAAVVGLYEACLGEPEIQALTDAWYHADGNVLAVLIELYNWYSRYSSGAKPRCCRPAWFCR